MGGNARRRHRLRGAEASLAEDMRAFRLDRCEYCRYADWSAHGARTRFYGHIDTSGDDVMMEARAIIAREIADGLWD